MTRHRVRIEGRLTGPGLRPAVAGCGEVWVRAVAGRTGAPVRRTVDVREGLVAIGVLPGRHATLPWCAGGTAKGRFVVVGTPMSGIIVAHHASCSRRDPRIPPVR
ncbi:hypothetical protein [Nocardia sp. NPDC058633]|uniref:hypothetical protein n=1 Tax=Nocardia sp. NPDC058633 TaxID=3346568 RepID=UPI00364D6B8E